MAVMADNMKTISVLRQKNRKAFHSEPYRKLNNDY